MDARRPRLVQGLEASWLTEAATGSGNRLRPRPGPVNLAFIEASHYGRMRMQFCATVILFFVGTGLGFEEHLE